MPESHFVCRAKDTYLPNLDHYWNIRTNLDAPCESENAKGKDGSMFTCGVPGLISRFLTYSRSNRRRLHKIFWDFLGGGPGALQSWEKDGDLELDLFSWIWTDLGPGEESIGELMQEKLQDILSPVRSRHGTGPPSSFFDKMLDFG